MLATVHEITEKIVGERRLAVLRDRRRARWRKRRPPRSCELAVETLGDHRKDVPFALIYLIDADGAAARLVCAARDRDRPRFQPGRASSSRSDADRRPAWPLARGRAQRRRCWSSKISGLASTRFPAGHGPTRRDTAVLVPLRSTRRKSRRRAGGRGQLAGSVSTREYRSFLELVAAQIATALANARAYEEERRRAEALAEIDRAKTAFFSNASHEFRTPLTLMLGPLEDAAARSGADLGRRRRDELELMHRNGLRLLKLVNTLLDFSRIEAGRFEAVYEPVDLAALTADLASTFRSAMERAGLRFGVDCPPLAEPVYVARDMWEKIVLNLLSNAFKYTFEGEVAVSLGRARRQRGRTDGRATPGSAFPPPNCRASSSAFIASRTPRARTQEGTGIGLALVHELVRLHGGRVRSRARPGRAASSRSRSRPAARTWRPNGSAASGCRLRPRSAPRPLFKKRCAGSTSRPGPNRLPKANRSRWRRPPSSRLRRRAHWLLWPTTTPTCATMCAACWPPAIRWYGVANGMAALEEAQRRRPDLILSDAMMPQLDGFGLLRAVRNDPRLREVPVILLSARASEDAQVEGLNAGADDYLTKPFCGPRTRCSGRGQSRNGSPASGKRRGAARPHRGAGDSARNRAGRGVVHQRP